MLCFLGFDVGLHEPIPHLPDYEYWQLMDYQDVNEDVAENAARLQP